MNKSILMALVVSVFISSAQAEDKGLCSPNEANHHLAFFGISTLEFENNRFSMGVSDKGNAVVSYSANEKSGYIAVGFPNGVIKRFTVSPQRTIYVIGNNMFFDHTDCQTSGAMDPAKDKDPRRK